MYIILDKNDPVNYPEWNDKSETFTYKDRKELREALRKLKASKDNFQPMVFQCQQITIPKDFR